MPNPTWQPSLQRRKINEETNEVSKEPTAKDTQTTTMSSSNNAFYGFEDDDTTTSPVKPPANTMKKKKKKKKSKKSSDKNKRVKAGNGLSNNPAALLKQKLLSFGYSSAQIDLCIDQMFSSGERYDDYESVKAKLDGKTSDAGKNTEPPKHSNTSTKDQDADGFVPVKTIELRIKQSQREGSWPEANEKILKFLITELCTEM